MLLKVTEKILLDRNTFIVLLFYRLHGNIINIVIVTLILLLSPYRPSNQITWILIVINNNIN